MNVTENYFLNNSALMSGGAIYYDSISPVFDLNRFLNNSALYGAEKGSYAVKLDVLGEEPNYIDFFSGITIDIDIVIELKD
jgi:predicted outer membrane repeat protein